MKRIVYAVILLTWTAGLLLIAQTRETARPIPCDPDNGGITLPAEFCAAVAVDGIGIGRQMAVAANGDLFVATRNSESSQGAIVALRDTNGDGKFDARETFAPEGGTGLALRPGYVYLGQDTRIVRYPRKEGELKPSGPAETIATLPDQSGHRAKGLAFDEAGGMYVNVGAPSNACQSTGENDRKPGVPGQMPCPDRKSVV